MYNSTADAPEHGKHVSLNFCSVQVIKNIPNSNMSYLAPKPTSPHYAILPLDTQVPTCNGKPLDVKLPPLTFLKGSDFLIKEVHTIPEETTSLDKPNVIEN